jgi:regulator-associated protein of mTOR
MLLSRFLDLGPWSVNLALSVGIFPYILKLLQSPAAELKLVLVFIWAKILAVDGSCQADLVKDAGYAYFIGILAAPPLATPNASEHHAMCVFILCVFCDGGFKQGQQACLESGLIGVLMGHVGDSDGLLRQWVALGFGKFWDGFAEGRSAGVSQGVHLRLFVMLRDAVPEVRTAAVYALGTLMGDDRELNEVIALGVLEAFRDASPIVRKELAVTLGKFVEASRELVLVEAVGMIEERHGAVMAKRQGVPPPEIERARSIYTSVWGVLLALSVDSSPSVAEGAARIVDAVNTLAISAASTDVLNSYYIKKPKSVEKEVMLARTGSVVSMNGASSRNPVRNNGFAVPVPTQNLRKSASFANSLRSLAGFAPVADAPARSRYSTGGGYGMSVPVENTMAPKLEKRGDSDIALDVVAGGRTFFDSCCAYFTESQMRVCAN